MKIIRVDMDRLTIEYEDYKGPLTGGRGFTAQKLLDEVPPRCEPMGPKNKIIITGGILNNLGLSGAERLSVGGKSPLTGGVKESNSGGTAGLYLGRQGIKALILEGKGRKDQLNILHIREGRASILPGLEYKGLGNYELVERLRNKFGKKSSVISIGPAGEAGMLASAIAVTDAEGLPNRFAARGGLGAVLGSKGIKAIVVDNQDLVKPGPKDREAFLAAKKEYHERLINHLTTGQWFKNLGTAGMVNMLNSLGALPHKNFSCGEWEKAVLVSGEKIAEVVKERGGEGRTGHACMPGCVVRCSNIFPDGKGKTIVGPLEYETIAMLGINLDIDDLDAIARMNRLCNDLGLDTIEIGGALGVAAESGLIGFGDVRAVLGVLDSVAKKDVLGMLIGSGAAATGKVMGSSRIPVVKGQTISAYDPRAVKGTGLTFATTPMGGDHTAGLTVFSPIKHHLRSEENINASRNSQVGRAAFDTLGICCFHMAALLGNDTIPRLLKSVYGDSEEISDVFKLGIDTIRAEKRFNELAGIAGAADTLPEFFFNEELPPYNYCFDFGEDEIRRVLGDI